MAVDKSNEKRLQDADAVTLHFSEHKWGLPLELRRIFISQKENNWNGNEYIRKISEAVLEWVKCVGL